MKSTESSIDYPFDNAAPQAGTRLASLAAIYDAVTFRHLDRFGIREGCAAWKWVRAEGRSPHS